jgi:hypothetical protein
MTSSGLNNLCYNFDSIPLLNLAALLQVVPRQQHCQLAYLSGPSFAAEVAAGMPTGLTIAARVSLLDMLMCLL